MVFEGWFRSQLYWRTLLLYDSSFDLIEVLPVTLIDVGTDISLADEASNLILICLEDLPCSHMALWIVKFRLRSRLLIVTLLVTWNIERSLPTYNNRSLRLDDKILNVQDIFFFLHVLFDDIQLLLVYLKRHEGMLV